MSELDMLIDTYERRLKTALSMYAKDGKNERIRTKISCFKTTLFELNKLVKPTDSSIVEVPLNVVGDVLKYCEDNQIYDKLGSYHNFYYKLNQLKRETND